MEKFDVKEVRDFYDKLMDEQSRSIFKYWLTFDFTGDWNCMREMLHNMPELKNLGSSQTVELISYLYECQRKGKEIIIYGFGTCSKIMYNDIFQHIKDTVKISSFCDSDKEKQKNNFCGVSVISPEELKTKIDKVAVIIGTYDYREEVYSTLIEMGIKREYIVQNYFNPPMRYSMDQYFEDGVVAPEKDEVFIDGGSFDCGDSVRFSKWCNGDYKKIYAFEPSSVCYDKCKEIIKKEELDKIELIKAGLWSKNGELSFIDRGEWADSTITENGENKIKIVAIDEILKGEKATFIKMDIEGAELEALKGAKETITKYKPKLAICIYHNPEDIIQLPLYINKLNPEYKFYIRQYCNYPKEAVLYAI